MLDSEFVTEELENAVRVVLMNLKSLHPFSTQHFCIFPYTSRWERVSELRFRRKDVRLFAYPYVITLYVESRELEFQHRVNHLRDCVPPGCEFRSDSSQLPFPSPVIQPKRRRTEYPHEGTHSQSNITNKLEQHHPQCFQKFPDLADSAEEMVCGSELHADSEVPSQPAPGAKIPACEAEQEVFDMSDSKSTVREKPGILSRLASAVFPFSLLFNRS